MKTLRIYLAVLTAGAAALTAFPYGQEGHEAIWILAKGQLKPATKTKVQNLIGNDSIAKAAVWADWIRLRELGPGKTTQTEINSVTKKGPFKGSNDWHFVDLPLGATKYEETLPSAGPNDVVHGLETCIALLEKPDNTQGNLVHQRALRFIIHLVGDIHQPLHVACGYYRISEASDVEPISDPNVIEDENLRDDRGGNKLTVGSSNLHHIWDTDLTLHLTDAAPFHNADELANFLAPTMAGTPFWHTAGDYHHWPEAWATDAIGIARSAYTGIAVDAPTPAEKPSVADTEIEKTPIVDFDKKAYIRAHREEAKGQIVKAAGRLADLLNSIQWAD